MIHATFKVKHSTTIICCNSTNHVSDEMDIITFYDKTSYLFRDISKYNVLIIGWDINTQIGKDRN